MQNIKFYDTEHKYEVNGEEYPSVSEISRFASREVYGNEISKFVLDNACERGTAIHKATEELDTNGTCDISENYIGYINAYIQFREDFNIKEYLYIEKPLASENRKFAGTLDRVYICDEDFANAVKKHCKFDVFDMIGKYIIIDIKSSSQVQKALAQIQLPAYSILLSENENANIVGLYSFILHLKSDGKYKLIPFVNTLELFNSCLTLHNALKKKKRSKK